jgi:anti-sigma B factor antagonist
MADTGGAELQLRAVELLQCSIASSEKETTVALDGEIDLTTAGALSELLGAVLAQRPVTVAVDLTRVSFLDSTGIKSLAAAAKTASELGCKFVVRHPSSAIERIFRICGVDRLLLDDFVGDATDGR